MLAQRFHRTQALAKNKDVAGLEKGRRLVQATLDAKGDHATEACALLLGNGVAGVRR